MPTCPAANAPAATGTLVGNRLASHLPGVALRRAFACLVLSTAICVLWKSGLTT